METFSDLIAYNLEEIILAAEYQNRGIGSHMMKHLEHQVKSLGAAMVQLKCVNDEMHQHFYGKLGYYDAANLRLKARIL